MAKCHNVIFNEMPHTASRSVGRLVHSCQKKTQQSMHHTLYIVVPVCTWNMYMYMLHTSCHVHAYCAKLIAACTCTYIHAMMDIGYTGMLLMTTATILDCSELINTWLVSPANQLCALNSIVLMNRSTPVKILRCEYIPYMYLVHYAYMANLHSCHI